jgi:hypothetical protein
MSKINDLQVCYESNKSTYWKEWLKFECIFDKPGKQGLVGLLQSKSDGIRYVFKISQYINYLIQHESVVMNGLNSISSYCPHFCRYVGNIMCDVNPAIRKTSNPFDTNGVKYTIQKEVMLCEYIANSQKMYNYIRCVDKIHEDVLYSIIKQVLMALIIAQNKKRFTHYDLHSNNVMIKKCNKDLVFLYVLDDENQFCVPTHGYYPVIIDFGFSYIEDLDDGPLWPSMAHTDAGFMSDRFDWVADPKLFLVTVSNEMKDKRDTPKSHKLRRIIRNMFYPIKMEWDSGWDEGEKKGASDYVTQMLKGYSKTSKIFTEYEHYCIDLLQSLIIMPLEQQNYTNIHVSYIAFLGEWLKLENQIESPFYNIYILKIIVDNARFVCAAYNDSETSRQAIKTFKKNITNNIDKMAKFCNLSKIHWEKLLCSLLVLAKNIEGVFYDVITTRMKEKQKQYDRLPLQSSEQMYAAIETNLSTPYVYNQNTKIFIVNSINQTGKLYSIPCSELKTINKLPSVTRGTYIYDLYKKTL